MEQEGFEFEDAPKSVWAEPLPKVKIPRRSTSICSYCGSRMPSVFLTVTPPIDDNRWEIATPYHMPGCRWIASRGLRLEEGD